MAMIGMRYVVASPLQTHTDGSEPTYGTGFVVGGAISGNLSITRNDNDLYYDDALGESDNGITAMSLELGIDDLLEEVEEKLLNVVKKTSNSVNTYHETTKAAPYVGLGYIRVRRKNGETKYQAVWAYKAQFGQTGENTTTKGQTIEWQTPTITGKIAGIDVDGTGDDTFRKKQVFTSESAAKNWLKTLAGIT